MSDIDHASATPAASNVYASIGLPEAAGMQVKAQLARQIQRAIKDLGINQAKAAVIVDMTESKLSGLVRGQFRGISEHKMMACLSALGNDVEIVVKPLEIGEVGRIGVVARKGPKRTPNKVMAGLAKLAGAHDQPVMAKKRSLRKSVTRPRQVG